MSNQSQIGRQIESVREHFNFSDLEGTKQRILKALRTFEKKTDSYRKVPEINTIIIWHRSLYLQKAGNYNRAEELLDEALNQFESFKEPVFVKWQLKTLLSLGYNHKNQHNYLDAEFYLKEALKLSLTENTLVKFQGELYGVLAQVYFKLNRYQEALKYAAIERDKAKSLYQSQGAYGLIYANALVNYCQINRLIGSKVNQVIKILNESISIFNKMNDDKGLEKARLEKLNWLFERREFDKVWDTALILEEKFRKKGYNIEYLKTGLLITRIYKATYEYDQAEQKLDDLYQFAVDFQLDRDHISAEILYEKGCIYEIVEKDDQAFEFFRKSAKISMTLGIKNDVIRAFNAARRINPSTAKELITYDLVYQDSQFVKNRLDRNKTLFTKQRPRIMLFATTLFMEIEGFSNILKNSVDQATVDMIDELIDRLCLIIYQNGGYIDNFLANGFMAIFEHGQNQDMRKAIAAVKSGTDILRALRHKNRKLKKTYGANHSIKLRIGLSTAEICALVLGKYISREYIYFGESINLASTLKRISTRHMMLIDDVTFRLVKDRVLAKKMKVEITDIGKEIDAYQIIRMARDKEYAHLH